MKRKLLRLSVPLLAGSWAFAGTVPLAMEDLGAHRGEDPLLSSQMITAIPHYREGFAELFMKLQPDWFRPIYLWAILGVLAVFLLHYLVIGPKIFSHEGRKYYIFNLFERIVHWVAAVGFVLLVPTGLVMIYGSYFGGGDPVRYARYLHSVGTVLFVVAVVPMFLMWFVPMIGGIQDIKWLLTAGGYLSRKKTEVSACKFNAGQKTWFWVATLGGTVMILTGALMYFQNIDFFPFVLWDQPMIEKLRASAIVHNLLGVLIAVFFITHIYMAVFAIKGALQSMIDGYKSEDELKHLHSLFFKRKLQNKGKEDSGDAC